ncbi:hypothetical protein Ciccas_008946 [Cichlidogyrus casuarinus]|uniref:Uncharacterized protein n=1 Tax=Cichlidogyrus casuarinus TaxID=1844966 RepID=A0ABD2Q166_9PLAT
MLFHETGSRSPGSFKNTDADFNLGMAMGCLLSSREPGVFIAIGCQVLLPYAATRDAETGVFSASC